MCPACSAPIRAAAWRTIEERRVEKVEAKRAKQECLAQREIRHEKERQENFIKMAGEKYHVSIPAWHQQYDVKVNSLNRVNSSNDKRGWWARGKPLAVLRA